MSDLRHNSRLARALLLGAAVGDALGVPFEFRERGTFRVNGMTGHGTYNRPAGTWSDDTSLTLATADAICDGTVNLSKAAQNFEAWLFAGRWTADGVVFDVGNGTRRAVERLKSGDSVESRIRRKECEFRIVEETLNADIFEVFD